MFASLVGSLQLVGFAFIFFGEQVRLFLLWFPATRPQFPRICARTDFFHDGRHDTSLACKDLRKQNDGRGIFVHDEFDRAQHVGNRRF